MRSVKYAPSLNRNVLGLELGFDPVLLILAIILAFVPSLIYLVMIRYTEKYNRESWGDLGTAFMWGATMSLIVVVLIRGIFLVEFKETEPALASNPELMALVAVSIITPIAAELIKPVGLFFVRHTLDEAEDGLIYGAAIGLGYAAVENLLYGIFVFFSYGIETFLTMVVVRSISVVLINASATSLSCYGVTRSTASLHKQGSILLFPLFLFMAIGIHGIFNYLALVGSGGVAGSGISYKYSLIFAVGISLITISLVYFKIYRLDRIEEREAKEAWRRKEEKALSRVTSSHSSAWEPGAQVQSTHHGMVVGEAQGRSRWEPQPQVRAPPPRQAPPPVQQRPRQVPSTAPRPPPRKPSSPSSRPPPKKEAPRRAIPSKDHRRPSRDDSWSSSAPAKKREVDRSSTWTDDDDDDSWSYTTPPKKKGSSVDWDQDDDDEEIDWADL